MPKMRRQKPTHVEWIPHSYQRKGVEFMTSQNAAALFADPGTGKTSTTLAAFEQLRQQGVAKKMLVIAPRRVCQLVWWQESRQWTQFRHLRFAWLHNSRAPWDIQGPLKKKEQEAAREDADIFLINPEAVTWMMKHYNGKLPFDTVCIDELTKFKNSRAKRSKDMLKLIQSPAVQRVWGLTGSPTPNGYEDLFGQVLLLDGGNALGRYYTHFRDRYFIPDGFSQYVYKLADGAAERIEEQIKPLVLRIAAEDWLDLPQKQDNPIMIKLDDKTRKLYDSLKKEMILLTEEGEVTAANSAALYSKLAQLANGAIYKEEIPGQPREYIHVHDAKLDALEDLIEELSGAPLLVTYEFNHDLVRLRDRLGDDLPYLGKGTTDVQASEIERAWNANELKVLAVHPASSGHGLNFQKGGAQHICHFSATWDFELYDQVIQRILRQGNKADHVVNHLLLVENSIDELKYSALCDKDTTQDRFLDAINTAFNLKPTMKETDDMAFKKLKTKTEAVEEEVAAKPKPKGWPTKPAEGDDDETSTEEVTQEGKIRNRLKGPKRAQKNVDEPEETNVVEGGFSADVVAAIESEDGNEEAKPEAEQADEKPHYEDVINKIHTPKAMFSIQVGASFNDKGEPTPFVQIQTQCGSDQSEEFCNQMAKNVVATMEEMLKD